MDLYTHKVCTTDMIYTPKNGSPKNVGCSGVKFAGNDHLAVNHRISTANVALSETGDLAHGAVSDTDLAYVEFKTPCIKGSAGCADNQALDSLDMPTYYYIGIRGHNKDARETRTFSIRVDMRTAFAPDDEIVESPRGLFANIPRLASEDDAVHNGTLEMRYDRDLVTVVLGEPETCTVTVAPRSVDLVGVRMRVFYKGSDGFELQDYPTEFEFSGSNRLSFEIESQYTPLGYYVFEVYSLIHDTGDYKLTVSGCKAETTSVPPPAVIKEDDVANGTPVAMTVGTSYRACLRSLRAPVCGKMVRRQA